MAWNSLPSVQLDMSDWSYVEHITADIVETATMEYDVTMYGGLGWGLYLEIRWNGLRGLRPQQRVQVATALLRGDEETAHKLIREFGGKPFARITKFNPGIHYHVLKKKFDTFIEAEDYAARLGYETGAVEISHVYDREGD